MSINLYRFHTAPSELSFFGVAEDRVPCLFMYKLITQFHTFLCRSQENSPEAAQFAVKHRMARDSLRKREAAIALSAEHAISYAKMVKRDRFPEAEATIAQDAWAARTYACDILRAPWPEGEAAIATNANQSCLYAMTVTQARFLPGEPAIRQLAKITPWLLLIRQYFERYPEALEAK